MGWTIEVAQTTAYATASTAWPVSQRVRTWGASSALGFFGNASGGPVTVGTYQSKTALVYSTGNPTPATITTYVCNLRFPGGLTTDSGVCWSTGTGTETYVNRSASFYTTPRPATGIKFGFSTSGSVTVTQASAWFGVVNNAGVVLGDSSNAGFICRMLELTSSKGWTYNNISTNKKSMNVNLKYRQKLDAGTTAQWFLGLSLSPKSAGAKKGGVAIDITYS